MKRIIPAYAGSTGGTAALAAALGDHPRIRGEHYGMTTSLRRAGGSSPHTRGARPGRCRRRCRWRIIPAYAGSTVYPALAAFVTADHPRIRGEHVSFVPALPFR